MVAETRADPPPAAAPADGTPLTREHAALACGLAQAQLQAGRARAADLIVAGVLDHFPAFDRALALGGRIKEQLGEPDAALALYDRLVAVNPGHGLPFTRASLIRLRRAIGDPAPAAAPDPGRYTASMPMLGLNGRFGNQLLQYALLRFYAGRTGAQAATPDWIGRDLFGFADPLCTSGAADRLGEAEVVQVVSGGGAPAKANVAIDGYFCGSAADWVSHRAQFQQLFEPVERVRTPADAIVRQLAGRGRTLVAIHLRRGDYGKGRFWLAPSAWYREWLAGLWPTLTNPVLYIASDDPKAAADFAPFSPKTAADFGQPLPGADYFVDHWILRQASCLAVSNSTFSVTAALLNRNATAFLRPDRARSSLRPFDPWAERILLE